MKKETISYTALGNRLRKIRQKNSLTQAELAELIEKCPEFISKLETGKAHPSLNTLSSLCFNLNTEMVYILTGINYDSSNYLSIELMEALKSCSPVQIELITFLAQIISKYEIYKKI